MPQRRAHDALERLRLVRVAAERPAQTRMVEDERRADHRHPPQERALELEPEAPALRRRRLEQRVRARSAQHLWAGRADECRGTAVKHRLRRRDDDDEIGVDERRVDAQRHRTGGPELDEVVALDVVHLHVTMEAAGELRRDERLELLVSGPSREPARDEQRLVPSRDAQPLELRHRGGDRRLTRIAFGSRQRQVRWFDDDRRARSTRDERLERLAGQREAQRVTHRGADVRDRSGGRRRAEHERVVLGGHDHQPGTGDHRDARHGTCR